MYRNLLISLFLLSTSSMFSQYTSPYNIVSSDFKMTWLYPEAEVKEVGKYDKLELGVRVNDKINKQIEEFLIDNNKGLNPYNPEDISVEMIFVSPSYNEKKIFGFFYEDIVRTSESWKKVYTEYNWRVRFAPDEIGRWTFILKIFAKGEEISSFGSKFKCIESKNKGIVKRNYKGDETDRYLYLSETKKTFFTIGHNIAHSAYYKLTPKKADQHKQWLTELAENGGNFFRLELGAQNGLPDWNNYEDYTSKMAQMWEFDQLTEHAHELGLYFILFRHHTEVTEGESWDVARWANNPYKLGFDLSDRQSYFTNEEVIKWQKNALRYIFSRWGYNSSFAFYEYQEMDNWYKDLKKETGYNDKEAIHFVTEWYLKQKEFIKTELNYHQLFINTYATTPDYEYNKNSKGFFTNSDVIGFHKYGQDKGINIDYRSEKSDELFNTWNKPLFVEEMGVNAGGSSDYLPIYRCDKSEFHNAIWSTSFMGLAGTGMTWWWDRGIHEFEYYKDYNAIKGFFEGENLEEEKYMPFKWHNTLSVKRASIETFCLINKDATKVIGWVHNSTSFWRNKKTECLNELVDNGLFKDPYELKDGIFLGEKDNGTDFSKDKDAYTDKDGVQNVANKTFELKGLKSSGFFGKKEWYEIVLYSTETNKQVVAEKIKTNVWGKLKLRYPEGNLDDYSYKIKYLGEGKKAP